MHETLDEPIPDGASWAYIFGSGVRFLFVSQVITGVFLALYYVPSADHVHTVVSYIVKEVTSGSFIRSIHGYGSSGIIILLLLHIGQTILYGSYRGRPELLVALRMHSDGVDYQQGAAHQHLGCSCSTDTNKEFPL